MRAISDYRALLGLNQHEISGLLGVSRSQYSMFEIGKRDLPLNATQKLATLLVQVQSAKVSAKRKNESVNTSETRKLLDKMLRENHCQQLLAERKIATIKEKQIKYEAFQRVVKCIGNISAKDETSTSATQAIKRKAAKTENTNFECELLKMEIKAALLEFEKKLLVSKMEKFSKT